MKIRIVATLSAALLSCVSCVSTRHQSTPPSSNVDPGQRAEYLYKAFVLNRGFRPAKGYTGLWRTWYENGNPMTESTLLNNTRHGPAKEWNVQGDVIAEGRYLQGQEHEGTFRQWYYVHGDSDKHSYALVTFRKGVRHGPCSHWTRNGTKLIEGQYKNGKKSGLWLWWWIDGNLLAVGEYRDGKRWSGAFADNDSNRRKVRYYVGGDPVSKPPPFINTPLETD